MASILVVEDNPDAAFPLARFLERAGHAVRCVPDGREALVELLGNPPDAMLLDLRLPEMDGATLLEVARSYFRLQGLPVVIWTALADSPLLDRARRLRVNSVLLKAQASFLDVRKALEGAIGRAPA
jgi:two-component system response regulator AtoC